MRVQFFPARARRLGSPHADRRAERAPAGLLTTLFIAPQLEEAALPSAALAERVSDLPGDFARSGPEPALPYGDGEVDVVVASSVFTHLDRDHQRTWLSELRRIISPNGLLVASVAGEYAFSLGGSRLRRPRQAPGSPLARAAAVRKRVVLRRAGIIDSFPDTHLEGIAPSGYYRMVYQTRDFIDGHGPGTSSSRRSSNAGSPATRTWS